MTQITETQEPYIIALIPMFVIFCGHYLNFNFLSHSALVIKIIGFLTHLPLGIMPKNLFWSLSGYKELKLTKNRFQVIHFAGC